MSASSFSVATNSVQHPYREWGLAALVSLCVSLAVVTPFFFLGTASGHDVSFHMASWLDAANQWKQGVIFPRWTESANFGFGEPRFIFYPPLSWLLGAFLGSIIPWQAVAVVFIVGVQTFAGLSAYALLRELADSRFAAVLGVACFAANPYAVLIIYMRSDFAELLAIAFFPLLLLATLRLTGFFTGEGQSPPFRRIFPFAILFCAVWLSNAPAAVIATYGVTLLFVLAAFRSRSFRPLVHGFAGLVLGFGLASFYLIPAFYEQRWVNISGVLSGGLTPAENFLYAKTSDTEHDAFNRVASNIAVLLILWALGTGIAAWRTNSAAASHRKSRFFLPVSVLATAATLLMLPVSSILWRFLPELRFLQFPWRWMSILALCAIIFTAASAHDLLRWALPLLAALAIVGTAHYVAKHSWWDSDDMPALQASMNDGSGFEGTDEYDPVGDDRTDLPQKAPHAALLVTSSDPDTHKEAKVVIEKWTVEHRVIRIATRRPGRLTLHLVDYPAWRVLLNGNAVSVQHPNGTRQMIVPVPAGESELRVDFIRTIDRTAGGWISIASLVTWMALLFLTRRATQPAVG
jgi:hypothetical protein